MSDGLDFIGSNQQEEVVDISLSRSGELLPPKNDKILLIDADTIFFSACLNCEIVDELLPKSMMSEEELREYTSDPTYDEGTHSIRIVFDDDVDSYIEDKLNYMLEQTGCRDYELHLTGNQRQSFRYRRVSKMYKANRVGGRVPAGLHDSKVRWMENNPTRVFMWDEWEADDMVVALRRDNPDRYILAAVDKDVLYSLPGTHFNYYTSAKYGIDMKWVEVTREQAMKHHYMQALTGDSADNIPGLRGIGPKKAEKILEGCTTHKCMWDRVVEAYNNAGLTVIHALETMRLVSMHQLALGDDEEYYLNLWNPPVGVSDGKK